MIRIDVVVRCKNEMPHAPRVFRALTRPDLHVIVFDSGSTDGSREQAVAAGFDIVDIAPEAYVPGRVLNQAMKCTSGDVVAFVNADAVPLSDDAVDKLVAACRAGAAASYGTQVARPDARPITRTDYARVFPADPEGPGFRHFFSMAASAVRRDVWEALPFDPDLRYSEDVDWTFRVRALGRRIVFVPDARFEHSHDYDLRAMWKRMSGEGRADVPIFRSRPPGIARGVVLPLAAQTVRDVRAGIASPETFALRVVAQVAKLHGAREADGSRARPGDAPAPFVAADAAYTLDGDPAGEALVRDTLASARDEIRRELGARSLALILVGGFASGEGALDRRGGEVAIHNDLDLVTVVDGRMRAASLRRRCEAIGHRLTKLTGATVDLFPIAQQDLKKLHGRLLWVDAAVRGIRVLDGDPRVFAGLKGLSGRSVVPGEVGRLLANRSTGLALSRLAFAAGQDEASRAARHVAKAWQALGDALLLQVDRYAGRLEQRSAQLTKLAVVGAPWVRTIAEGYASAVRFRRDPASASVDREALEAAIARMAPCLAALESYRLGRKGAIDAAELAVARSPIFPELDDVPPPARAVAGLRAALKGRVRWDQVTRHPREVLARASYLLAFAPDLGPARSLAARWLGAVDDSPAGVALAVERLREIAA